MLSGLLRIFVVLLVLSPLGATLAQDADDSEELEQLLRLLDQQTSLATETKLNADFVPGIVSVMTGEQMIRRGFRTLHEAVSALPGVNATRNETGMLSVGVRGVGDLFEPSKVKLVLNGQAINPSAGATTSTIYATPVNQIERIEFIRGPGSAVFGEFAYAGVLQVITRSRGESYSAGVESSEGIQASLLKTFGGAGNDFRASINLAAGQTEGEDIDSGTDRTPAGTPSLAPGPINNKRDFVSVIFDLEIGDWTTLLQFQQANRGDHFGTNNLLPPDDRQTVISDSLLTASLQREFSLDDGVTGQWSVGLVVNSSEQNELFLGLPQNFGGLGTEDDIFADTELVESRIDTRAKLQRRLGRHSLYGELILAEVRVVTSEQFINLDPGTNLPSPTLNEFEPPVEEDDTRSSLGLVLEDTFDIDDSMTLTSGLRVDDYEDIGSSVTPRIALVWRRDDNQIFKAQLARAFRPPSLIEYNGAVASEVDAETIDTLEFGHIHQGNNLVIRNTLYFAELNDLIVFQDFAPFGYRNLNSTTDLKGYELELEQAIDTRWDLVGNLALQDYSDNDLVGATPWQLKLGLGHQLMPMTRINLEIIASGERDREDGDSRDDFDTVTQVDLSLLQDRFAGRDGLSLRAGIRNLLDERLEYPSPTATYADDYPYSDGALLWLQLIFQP